MSASSTKSKQSVASGLGRDDDVVTQTALADEWAPFFLIGGRLLAAQAMLLVIRLDRDLRQARAQWNQDWFRRIMRARSKAVSRLRRRWEALDPKPGITLGKMRRRYHANLAGYLCKD